MNDFSLELDTKPLVAEVGCVLRMARRRRRLSQREFAQQLGVSKSRLARLESDAGPQSLETVSQVLMASGFRLEVVAASGAQLQEDDGLAANSPGSVRRERPALPSPPRSTRRVIPTDVLVRPQRRLAHVKSLPEMDIRTAVRAQEGTST